ncbi:MAG: NADH-quinone oxidoreductase subunit L [Bacteroidales bacterium]|nr:NADH-quinone oxidoreductase subunit L [Bacteroidales bacterium]
MTQDVVLPLSILTLLIPLLSFLINIFFGKKLGKISGVIGTSILGIDLGLAIIVAFTKLTSYAGIQVIQNRIEWFDLGSLQVNIGIGIDNIAAIMLIVVTLISFLVHLFSTVYMGDDRQYSKFFAYLGLFTFSMLGIVIANNFLIMYIFWELVGISSYLLIGFWYEKDSASNAGKKAFITNRIGDLGFFIGIMILFFTYGSFMFEDVFAGISSGVMPFDNPTMLTIAGICIFMGAIGKSAQFPLHVWLPDAMEGPTPVSALIHAATMVAAGVYLVAKVFAMFTADALTFIAVIGTITAFISATIALTQVDFKKVLAYSTVSQLGFMIMSLGVGGYTNGFFHLVTHAWFKAALFLAAGSVIHAMHQAMHHMHDHHTDPQDINNMGGLRKTMPWTYRTFLFVTLALSGIPLTSGFLSKDGILAGTLAYANLTGGWHWIIPVLGFTAAGMTAFYMFRLTIVAFHGEPKTEIAKHTKENKLPIVLPLVVLAFMSLWIFYSPNPIDASKGWFHKMIVQPKSAVPDAYQWSFLINNKTEEAAPAVHQAEGATHTAEITAENPHEVTKAGHTTGHYLNKFQEETHHFHYIAMILSLLIAGSGILLAFLIYQYKTISADKLEARFKFLHTFSYNKWYFDELYQATAINGLLVISKALSWFDNYVVDGLVNLSSYVTRGFGYIVGLFDNYVIDGAVNLVANFTGYCGNKMRKLQTGHIQSYVVFVLLGILILLYFFI